MIFNEGKKIRVEYYLDDYQKFPWDIMDLSVPMAGSVMNYLCFAISKYGADPEHKTFYTGYPTTGELISHAQTYKCQLSLSIVSYCQDCDKSQRSLHFY